VAYGALRLPTGDVIGLVYLIRWAPKDHYNFGHKAMSEDMGPFEYDCPARILDMLTPTDIEYSKEWRAKCRERLAARAARPKVSKGAHVRFEKPIPFMDGRSHSLFEWERGNTFRFVYPHGVGGRASIRKWRELPYALA